MERTRAIKLVLDKLGLPRRDSNILHFAPEAGLAKLLLQASPSGYTALDYSPANFPDLPVRQFDIIADSPSLASNGYDLVIHSHVAEHIPCTLAYMFFHFSRALKPNGYHIFCLPLMPGKYEEDFSELPPDVAHRRFGQHDHIRRFGIEDLDRHLGAVMRLKPRYDLSDYASVEQMDAYNIPVSERSGFNGSTIFVARKDDYALSNLSG